MLLLTPKQHSSLFKCVQGVVIINNLTAEILYERDDYEMATILWTKEEINLYI